MPNTDTLDKIAASIMELNQQLSKLSHQMFYQQQELKAYIKKELEKIQCQNHALHNLEVFFTQGTLPEIPLWKGGYPANPDFVWEQVQLIVQGNYDLILEFGSGYTTFFTAKTLQKLKNQGRTIPQAQTFEHLQVFFDKTKADLNQAGLGDLIMLNHAPLRKYQDADGKTYPYYRCQERLAQLSQGSWRRIFVIVDGPPASTGQDARYPALPLVRQYFPQADFDLILDDYGRNDEQNVAKRWIELCQAEQIPHSSQQLDLVRDALVLSIWPSRKANLT